MSKINEDAENLAKAYVDGALFLGDDWEGYLEAQSIQFCANDNPDIEDCAGCGECPYREAMQRGHAENL